MSKNTAHAIEVTDLVKAFGKVRALQGLNLTVKTGEVHGFLGPNGAGKSTTIRVLLGLLRKSSGEARLLGGDPWKDAVGLHRRLAYVPGEVNLWPNLSGGEVIDMLCAMRGSVNKTRRNELVRRFELDSAKKIRTYSKGNRQKVAIISALASDVELYIFDEPTSGLDPLMGAVFQECVKEIRSKGKTVLLSSHILAEVEALCDTLTIIRQGKDVETGSLAEMRHLTRTSVTVTTALPVDLRAQTGIYDLHVHGAKTIFQVDTDKLNSVIATLAKADVKHLVCTPPTLEELFLRQYDDELSVDGVSEEALEKERQ